MSDTVDAEVWVMVGEDGQYSVHHDPDGLRARFDQECDGAGLVTRVVKLTVKVPRPKPVELVAVIAEETTTGEVQTA